MWGLAEGSWPLVWFESLAGTKEGALSQCRHKGQRDRSVLKAVICQRSEVQSDFSVINVLPHHEFPRIDPQMKQSFSFLRIQSKPLTGDRCTQAEGPHTRVDNALPCNTMLMTDVGLDFLYCETTAQEEQVCEELTYYSSQRLKDRTRGGDL